MKQLIAANWKMNGTPDWVSKVTDLNRRIDEASCDVLICPPHALLAAISKAADDTLIQVGGQDCSEHQAGAHTGETDAALLVALNASYVILGHSERRAAGETNERVKLKAERAQSVGLRPIICVGESLSAREAGKALSTVKAQLGDSLPAEGEFDIAYEPIWAIGTGKTATVGDVEEMHASIREIVGQGPRILYGGSVKPMNAESLLSTSEVGGALVGGASLEMESFAAIIAAAKGG